MGTALVNGARAPNGAVVTALVEIPLASPLTLEVNVTADNGQTATASRTVNVLHLLNAGEGIVSDGNYSVKVVQTRGQVFAGKIVRFKIDGQDAGQTAAWVHGDADVLNLTASAP